MDGDLCLMENMQMQKNNTYQNLREYKTFNKYSVRLRLIFLPHSADSQRGYQDTGGHMPLLD